VLSGHPRTFGGSKTSLPNALVAAGQGHSSVNPLVHRTWLLSFCRELLDLADAYLAGLASLQRNVLARISYALAMIYFGLPDSPYARSGLPDELLIRTSDRNPWSQMVRLSQFLPPGLSLQDASSPPGVPQCVLPSLEALYPVPMISRDFSNPSVTPCTMLPYERTRQAMHGVVGSTVGTDVLPQSRLRLSQRPILSGISCDHTAFWPAYSKHAAIQLNLYILGNRRLASRLFWTYPHHLPHVADDLSAKPSFLA